MNFVAQIELIRDNVILFILLGTVTQEILSLEETKAKIGKQISEIENNLLHV